MHFSYWKIQRTSKFIPSIMFLKFVASSMTPSLAFVTKIITYTFFICFLLPCRKSGACEATETSEGSCLHSASGISAFDTFFFNCDAAAGEQRCGTGRSGVQKREREDRAATEKTEKWSGAGQVPKMNSLGADRVHISQYARKQMQYRRNTRRIAYLARI
jgi:hypothetical protein